MASALEILDRRARQLYAVEMSARNRLRPIEAVRPVALHTWNELSSQERELWRRRAQLAIAGDERLTAGGALI